MSEVSPKVETVSTFRLRRPDECSRPSCCEVFQSMLFMFYDGIAFFGFAHHKLERVRGRPASCFDKCRNCRTIIQSYAFLVISMYIIFSKLHLLGSKKS